MRAEPIDLQLRWHHQFQFAGYYAAVQQGYYKNAGLDVVIHEGPPEKIPVNEVLRGHVQYGVTNSELLLARTYTPEVSKERLIHYLEIAVGIAVFISVMVIILYAAYQSIKRENRQRELIAGELRKRTDELALHNHILQRINQRFALPELLDGLARQVEKLHPKMLCSILLLDEHNQLRHDAAPTSLRQGLPQSRSQGWHTLEHIPVTGFQHPCWNDGLTVGSGLYKGFSFWRSGFA